ncbi:MAG: hydantoinase/oxoprolinase family protein [Burkholderiales bacterium]
MPSRLGIDVGDTHVDFLLFDDATGRTHAHKTPSTPQDPAVGVARGLAELIRTSGIRPADIGELVHGTRVPADLVQSRNGAKVGLLVTHGFEQVLHLAHARTFGPLNDRFSMVEPQALADLAMIRGVAERMSSRGDAIAPLDEASARRAIGELLAAGAQSLIVCLLHAYANAAHELQLKAIIRDLDGQIPVTLSHVMTLEAGEYERALATIMNAYVQPGMSRYVSSLQEKLRSAQLSPRISIVQSTGARASTSQAIETPVHTMLAGPAGGAAGAAHIASLAGYPDALALDMGGASTYLCLIRDGAARMSNHTALHHNADIDSINLPSLDVRRIGAGGAAIAHVPAPGTLRVGRQGAGAMPAAPGLGHGAAVATVTDANIVLGRLAATIPSSNVQAAQAAVASLARELGLDPHRAAEGIIEIANENMAGALRCAALEKGLDPTRLALVAFGGAGPMHACALGMLTGCAPVIVPRHAGVLSALGFLCSSYSYQFAQTIGRTLNALPQSDIDETIERLGAKASAWLAKEAPASDGKIRWRAEIGYLRSAFQISVSVDPATLRNGGRSALAGQLDEAHRQRFGFEHDEPIQLITMRAIATAPADRLLLRKSERAGPDPAGARIRQTQTYFDGSFVNTAVYERDRLLAGNRIVGPAIVVQHDTTIVILPAHVGEIDEYLNLLIRAQGTQH